jgi:Zn/Cd-binding protein ZinT
MKHIHTFESFLNEASAFDTRKLKNINFILQPFDKPYAETFTISFNNQTDKKEIENAIKSEKDAASVKYEWEGNKLILTPGKDNSGLTYIFKALDGLYGKYGEGMSWL